VRKLKKPKVKKLTQDELNEKAAYKKQCAQWKGLQERGDVQVIADMLGVSTVLVSKALNAGTGSLRTLREIRDYYNKRIEAIEAQG
jgi:hypothetical protein